MLTDFSGQNTYSTVIVVGNCGIDAAWELCAIYPNPSAGIFTLLFTGDKTLVSSIEIFNAIGEKSYTNQLGFNRRLIYPT